MHLDAPMKIDTYPFKLSQAMLTTFNKDVSDGVEKMQKSESGTFFAIILVYFLTRCTTFVCVFTCRLAPNAKVVQAIRYPYSRLEVRLLDAQS